MRRVRLCAVPRPTYSGGTVWESHPLPLTIQRASVVAGEYSMATKRLGEVRYPVVVVAQNGRSDVRYPFVAGCDYGAWW